MPSPPTYARISDVLKKELTRYSPGDLLPPEVELAERFEVNRHTVRRAIADLVEQGLVVRKRGRGTTVISNQISFDIGHDRQLTETVEALGHRLDTRLLGKRVVRADHATARDLQKPTGTPTLQIDTLSSIEDQPVGLSKYFVQADRLGGLSKRYTEGWVPEVVERELGSEIRRTRQITGAEPANDDDRLLLAMGPGTAILAIQVLYVDQESNRPLMIEHSRFRADAIRLQVYF